MIVFFVLSLLGDSMLKQNLDGQVESHWEGREGQKEKFGLGDEYVGKGTLASRCC